MRAVINGTTIASAPREDVVEVEGNIYFPPSSVLEGALHDSPTPYTCPWKGRCQYHHVMTSEGVVSDGAWSYPDLFPSAVERVGRDFTGYVAFDRAHAEIG